jgi:hypothetical protein
MFSKIKKGLTLLLPLIAVPMIAFGSGKATVSSKNQEAQSIAGVNEDGEMVVMKLSDAGSVTVTNPDGTNIGEVTSTVVTGTANGAGQYPIAATDVSAYKNLSLQLTGVYSGTLQFECSNDNINWVSCPLQSKSSVPQPEVIQITGSTTGMYTGQIDFRYFRARLSAYVSGTYNATMVLSTLAAAPPTQQVMALQDGSWVFSKQSDYPSGAVAVTASSGNVANAIANATLPSVSLKTNYLAGFIVTASGATAATVVNVTVTGTISGTMTYTFPVPAGATAAATPLIVQFSKPVPASGPTTPIVVSLPALGAGNTNAAVVASGYNM